MSSFRPFWPYSEGGRFVFFAHFGCFWRAVDLLLWATLAVFASRRFIILNHSGCFRVQVQLSLTAVWAVFGGRHFGRFRRRVDLLPAADLANFGGRGGFINFAHFGRFLRAVDISDSAVLALSGGRLIYHCCPFRPISEAVRFIIFRPFAHLGGQHIYYLGPFWRSSKGGTCIISDHFGLFQRTADLLHSSIFAFFGGR